MHNNSSQLKNDFIKKWVQALQTYCSSKKRMNLSERTKNIKLSADIALASAKNSTTCWSKAIISKERKHERNTSLVTYLSESESKFNRVHQTVIRHKRIKSKKIFKKSLGTCIAKRLVKKRTQVLKRLVPGGELMDEYTIIKEAMDYILSLRVQVDVMKDLVNATTNLNE